MSARFFLREIEPSDASFVRNQAMAPKGIHDERCLVCGRPMANYEDQHGTASVHMDVHGDLVLIESEPDRGDFPDFQGSFSVGSECAKKIPAEYKVMKL